MVEVTREELSERIKNLDDHTMLLVDLRSEEEIRAEEEKQKNVIEVTRGELSEMIKNLDDHTMLVVDLRPEGDYPDDDEEIDYEALSFDDEPEGWEIYDPDAPLIN